jgi:uncharacterized protein
MTQSWHDLLFAHWEIDPVHLRAVVPAVLPLDLHEGRAWLGIVPFRMTNVAPRGVPALPWLSSFPELNVRTYVSMDGKPGVYFLSLDAARALAVLGARWIFHLPYFTASMHVASRDGWVIYVSRRTDRRGAPARLAGRYRPVGASRRAEPDTLEYFLTERYCLYTTDGRGTPYRLDIHHAPWPLQPAELELDENTMAEAAGLRLPPAGPLLSYTARMDVVAWPIRPVVTPRT